MTDLRRKLKLKSQKLNAFRGYNMWRGVNFDNIFIALFHVSGYVDQFKAIKQKPLREVGTSDPWTMDQL